MEWIIKLLTWLGGKKYNEDFKAVVEAYRNLHQDYAQRLDKSQARSDYLESEIEKLRIKKIENHNSPIEAMHIDKEMELLKQLVLAEQEKKDLMETIIFLEIIHGVRGK